MVLKDILAISGSNGLYRFVSQARNGIIVEGLSDKKRFHSPASARISALEDIAVYTAEKEVPLKEILQSIFRKENGGPAMDPKSPGDALKRYFETILPDYDRERVYVSDLKKIFTWYNILVGLNLIDLEPDEEISDGKDEKTTEPEIETSGE